jgi:imidazolonepropionase
VDLRLILVEQNEIFEGKLKRRRFDRMFAPRPALQTGLATHFDPLAGATMNMQAIIAQAWELGMSAASAIAAGTIGGALELGLAERLGSIEAGKQADLVVLNAQDYEEMFRRPGANLVGMVIKRGRPVYVEGRVADLTTA